MIMFPHSNAYTQYLQRTTAVERTDPYFELGQASPLTHLLPVCALAL